MTLILDSDIGALKMYPYTENEVCRSMLSKVRGRTGQTYVHTDIQTNATERITKPHSRVMNSKTYVLPIDHPRNLYITAIIT